MLVLLLRPIERTSESSEYGGRPVGVTSPGTDRKVAAIDLFVTVCGTFFRMKLSSSLTNNRSLLVSACSEVLSVGFEFIATVSEVGLGDC